MGRGGGRDGSDGSSGWGRSGEGPVVLDSWCCRWLLGRRFRAVASNGDAQLSQMN